MQKQEAIDLADRIMAEAPSTSVRVEHEGAYAPDSYAVQIQQGLVPNIVTINSAEEWERYRAGLEVRQDQWAGREEEMDQSYRPDDGRERPTQ